MATPNFPKLAKSCRFFFKTLQEFFKNSITESEYELKRANKNLGHRINSIILNFDILTQNSYSISPKKLLCTEFYKNSSTLDHFFYLGPPYSIGHLEFIYLTLNSYSATQNNPFVQNAIKIRQLLTIFTIWHRHKVTIINFSIFGPNSY